MKRLPVLLFILLSVNCFAQRDTKELPVEKRMSHAEIEDYYIGWEGGLSDPNKTVPAKTLGSRTYTAKQMNDSRKFIQWMQASYTPKGCIGIAKYFQNRGADKYKNFGLTTFYHEESIPHLYGAFAQTWQPIKKKADGTFVPVAHEPFGERWNISVNQLEYITTAINCISTPGENYFMMPTYVPGEQSAASFPYAAQKSSYLNFDKHPNLQPYRHFVIPSDMELVAGKGLYVVIITKNNQPFPVEGITLGEFLNRLEKNIPTLHKDFYESRTPIAGALEQAQKNMALIKQTYKNRFDEEARIDPAVGLDFLDIKDADKGVLQALEIKSGRTTLPVLRLKKGVTEACKNSPQWIAVYWSMTLPDLPASVHMMESILNNFNFKYVYDYHFGNDKVIAPYKPLRPPLAESPSDKAAVASSKTAESAAKDKNVLFFDDFSAVALDGYPPNWKSGNDFRTGYKAKVKEMNGSKWMEFTSHKTYPQITALSADFNLSFNLAVVKDIPYSTKPITIGLTDKDVSLHPSAGFSGLEIKITPGNSGNPGNLWLDGGLGSGYSAVACEKENNRTYPYLKVPGFSNNKQLNTITLQVIKKGESLQILSDGQIIYECKKAVPSTIKLKNIVFFGGENDDYRKNYYYIGNVKVERL